MNKPLFDAITDEDNDEALAPLLADLEGRDPAGHTPLEHAFLVHAVLCAEALLAAGANPRISSDVLGTLQREVEPGDYSPLGLAVYAGAARAARCLVESGAPPDDPGSGGLHPIHIAAMKGMTEIVALLLDRGVPVDVPLEGKPSTALVQAVSYNRLETVILLVARGADVGVKNGKLTLEQMAKRQPKILAALRRELVALPETVDHTERTKELIAPYRDKVVTAALDGILFGHVPATFHFFFDDPARVRAFLREEYTDETRGWSFGEVVPVASVSWSPKKHDAFAWVFLDWRGGKTEPALVVTTTDRWDDSHSGGSLAELGLAIGADRQDDAEDDDEDDED
jgi:hypothetical protein